MGGFLYEVDEMEGNLWMGKLIVDEMEGSRYCGDASKKQNRKEIIWESVWESQQNEEKEYVVNSQHDVRLPGLPSLKGNKNGMSVKSAKRCCECDNSCG